MCATSEKLGKPFRFRSYESPWDISDDCPIWQACRATSAAPTFFPPMEIGKPPKAYVDGGLGSNNPVRALLEETSHIWPSRKLGCIVSIGTGVLKSRDVEGPIIPLIKSLIAMATDAGQVACDVEKDMTQRYGEEQRVYFRFDVQHGMEDIDLEAWGESDGTELATRRYLQIFSSQVNRCASQLHQPICM